MEEYANCTSHADDSFGPQVVAACRQGFDFTLTFEQAILSAVPSALLIIASAIYILQRHKESIKTLSASKNVLKWTKLITVALYAATQLAMIIFWSLPSAQPTRASIPASVLSLAGAVAMGALTYVNHDRSVRPSTILCIYLLLSGILDVSQARTLYLRPDGATAGGVFTTGLALKAVCLAVEMIEKRRLLRAPYRSYPPEALGGVVNRSLFWWLNPLLRRGASKPLGLGDLFNLDKDLESEKLGDRFRSKWNSARQSSSLALLWTAISSAKKPLLVACFARFLMIGFKFAQPLLIKRAVALLTEEDSQSKTNIGRALIGATLLVYLGIAITNGQHAHNTYRAITMFRGGIISLIYESTLKLNTSEADASAALTLMSTDIDRIAQGFELFATLWAGPVEIALGTYLLSREIGVVCVAPVSLAVLFVLVCLAFGKASASSQKSWMEAVQERVAETSIALGNMKALKMTGLFQVLATRLQELRVRELGISTRFRWILTVTATINNMSLLTLTTVTIVVYLKIGQAGTLDPSLAFTSISLITLVSAPVQELTHAIPSMAAAIGCLERIQKYIQSPSSGTTENPSSSSTGLAQNDGIELSCLGPSDAVLSLREADFSFKPGTRVVLENISLNLLPKTQTVVLGPIGCGKSALLLALLGELHLNRGSLHRKPSTQLAYCAQDPWLPNRSIRQIIIGHAEHDSVWFSEVARACALLRDFQNLPQGAETVVGSNGVSLSGGQRQRVSLARSLYSRKPVLLLDDVLSGLDPTTDEHIGDHVFGKNGLCQRNGLTVLLATHSVRHALQADQVIAMSPDGSISAQGPPDTVPFLQWDHKIQHSGARADKDQGPGLEMLPDVPGDGASEELRTELSRQTGDVLLYGYYFASLGWINSLGVVLADALFAFCVTFPTVWIKRWSEAQLEEPGRQMDMYMGIYGMFSLAGAVVFFAVIYLLLHIGMPRSSLRLHRSLLAVVVTAPYWFFASTDGGQILNRFSQDMSLIDMQLPMSFVNTVFSALIVLMQAGIIGSTSKWAVAMYPALILGLYVLQKFYLKTSRQLRLLELEAKSPLYTHFTETLRGLSTIRAFDWQRESAETNLGLLDDSQKPYYLLWSIQRWLTFVLDCNVAIIATVIIAVATQVGDISAGSLGMALVNILTFSQNLTFLIRAWVDLETSLGAIARLRDFEESTPSETLPQENLEPRDEWPSTGLIELRNLSVAYKSGDQHVLKGLNLSIHHGQTVAICGRTGSGKSSFVLSLLRLAEIEDGDIIIDGQSLRDIPRDVIRRRLTVMPQEAIVLPGPVRSSMDPWAENSDDTIVWALREVGLWNIFLDQGGLDAKTEQLSLSRGQRQLFGLAHALIGRSKIIILDEATSNTDPATQKAMMEVLGRTSVDKTLLVVTHHIHTTREFDRVLVLDHGELAGWGTPEELMQTSDIFKELWESEQHSSMG